MTVNNTPKAQLIIIGDEILIGQVMDTNASFIVQKLDEIGVETRKIVTIHDDEQQLLEALRKAVQQADIILTTGGLGPTRDDLTKKTLCQFFDDSTVFDETVYQNIQKLLGSRNITINALTRSQADVPSKATILPNIYGTAPGLWMEKENKVFISLPGVPFEMKSLMEREAVPRLKKRFQTPYIIHRTALVTGMAESLLAEKIARWEDRLPENIRLAYLPAAGQVRLRLSGKGANQETLKKQLQTEIQKLSRIAGMHIVAYEDTCLEELVGRLLRKKGWTLATAESCTGGLIASKITSIPGSSVYYQGTIVAYQAAMKRQLLGVPASTIETHTVVSRAVAEAMAQGALDRFASDVAISATGVAGPSKGEDGREIGTLCVGLAAKGHLESHEFQLGRSERKNWIEKACVQSLQILHDYLLSI